MSTAPVHGPDASLPTGHWIVVADSPFLPARGGGEREHLGFVRAASRAGLLSALVIPTDSDAAAVGRQDDLAAIRSLVAPAPVIEIPRTRALFRALQLRTPYVVASRPVPDDLLSRISEVAPDADAVVIFSYKSHRIGRALADGLELPVVLRQHNLEGPYHRSLAAAAPFPRSVAVRVEAERINADERRLEQSGWLSGIADISAADAALRSQRAGVPVRYVPPFALDSLPIDRPWKRPTSDVPTVVFLGALDVGTNHDAVTWFADAVWPKVRSRLPTARWSVVGRRPTDAVRKLITTTPGADLHADVADPAVYLHAAGAAINPAVSGSGVNIKLVEYLATGVPVVSTSRGTDGLLLEPGRDLMVSDDPADFAASVVSLLTDPDTAETTGGNGRRTALSLMDTRAGLTTIAGLLAGPPNTTAAVDEPGLDDCEVVLVSYRSRQHVQTLLDGWPDDLAVAVVDNSANADGIADLTGRYRRLRYVSGGGQGFARAANLGATSSIKPYVIFVNPDSRPTAADLLALVRGLAADPRAVSHAATVTGADGRVEIGVGGWEPSVGRLAVHAVGLHKLLPRAGLFAEPQLGEPLTPGWTTGACMAVRADLFAELGGFDETFFVYAEDMAFGRRARAAGWQCRLREDVVVAHGAGSSGAPSAEMLRLRGASFAGYLRRYHPGPRGVLMRGFFAAGTAGRMVAQRATGRSDAAALSRALLTGTLTGRAFVDGVEVARSRYDEVAH
ncbi:glycosyltransferase [Microlunatus soli]|uniref:glycosyltransferase n=1 Tax=Microlunatus soli TaxID=630515 RepID=UPI00155F7CF3|nr:glycosyltransferase [Microlunatus soli]